jgi:hypothetical protein
MTPVAMRHCQACGTRLAWDNQDAFCSPCRKSRRSVLGPPSVPEDFWQEPELRAALGEWHIGKVIRAYRCHPFFGPKPLPQDLVAGWLDLTQAQVSRIESGPVVTDLDKLIPWARTLGIPQRWLWFKVREREKAGRARDPRHASDVFPEVEDPPGYTSGESPLPLIRGRVAAGPDRTNEEDPTQRRQALGAMGLALAGAIGPASHGVAVSAWGIPRAAVSDVRVIRDMLGALTTSDRQFGGGHARQYATDYLVRVIQPRLHTSASEHVRHELFTVATEFALRVASMQLDAGQVKASRKLLATSSSLAQETDDLTLSAWTLARRGELEIHERHFDRALAYTGGAVAIARSSPPVARAFILTKHALALSMSSSSDAKTETLQTLGQVWDSYSQAGSTAEPSWMQLYGWGNLRHEEGRCFYNLGMGEEAARAAEESLPQRTSARPRAFSLGVMAIGYAQAGHIDQACAISHELIALTGQLDSERVRGRLREVLQALAPHRDVAADVRNVFGAAQPVLSGGPMDDSNRDATDA